MSVLVLEEVLPDAGPVVALLGLPQRDTLKHGQRGGGRVAVGLEGGSHSAFGFSMR
jgi:hypothetical protein